MSNNDKIKAVKELYSTAYTLNIGMLEFLNDFKHLNELYYKAFEYFKNLNAYIFSDDVQLYVEEINVLDRGVDNLIKRLQANIIETNEMETYLFKNSNDSLIN